MLQSIFITISILILKSQSIHLALQQGSTIVCNSSLSRGIVSVSISSFGSRNQFFQVQSQVLSPLVNRHKFTFGQNRIQIGPILKQQLVMFNDYDANTGQYWLTLKHKLVFNKNKDIKFIGITFYPPKTPQTPTPYLLPTFKYPYTFLPINSFYHCHTILVGLLQYDKNIDIALFARLNQQQEGEHVTWYDQLEKWGWNWRLSQGGFDFGRYTRYNGGGQIEGVVRIQLTNGRYCQFDALNMERKDNSNIKLSRYLTFQQVLQNSTPLQLFDYPLTEQQQL